MLQANTKTIYNATIVTVNNKFDVIENGYLTIKGNIITEIGQGKPNAENLYNAEGRIIIPGFVNAHTHLPMAMYRGIADDLPLKEWLEEHIWPAEAELTHEETVRKSALLGMEETIRTGTTTFCDMYFFADAVAEETVKMGLRAVMNEGILDFPTNSYKNVDEALNLAENFIKRWKGHRLINPALVFHATYTCSKATIERVHNLASKHNLSHTTHVSETEEEVENVKGSTGMNPPHFLNNIGMLSEKTIAAHCVWLNEKDQKLFADKKANVVHCPSSNLKLGSGIAPIPTYLRKGINVALGTDGCASNNNLDMVEEMRLAALLHKGANKNPTVIPAREALKMATLNGAIALGLDDKIGSIEVGKHADIVLIETKNTFMQPIYDYHSAIVYAMNSSCIDTVMVDGKVLMENKKLTKNNSANSN